MILIEIHLFLIPIQHTHSPHIILSTLERLAWYRSSSSHSTVSIEKEDFFSLDTCPIQARVDCLQATFIACCIVFKTWKFTLQQASHSNQLNHYCLLQIMQTVYFHYLQFRNRFWIWIFCCKYSDLLTLSLQLIKHKDQHLIRGRNKADFNKYQRKYIANNGSISELFEWLNLCFKFFSQTGADLPFRNK